MKHSNSRQIKMRKCRKNEFTKVKEEIEAKERQIGKKFKISELLIKAHTV